MFDLIIKNGKIINGTGCPYFLADIGIKDGKIEKIGKDLSEAKKTIDASGLTVTPGFIDSHSHNDNALLSFPELKEKIEQGITTSIAGQCGSSPAPVMRGTEFTEDNKMLTSHGAFLDTVKEMQFGANTACLIGHSAIRRSVMGMDKREPTVDELKKMKEHIKDAMERGAFGMSFGLIYPPGSYAKTDELIELAKVIGEYHGILAAHIRNEGNNLVKSVEEFIKVVKESKTRGVISHHKSAGKENWGKVSHTLRMIDEANKEGIEIYCDVYPYTASHTTLSVTVVPDSGQNLLERLKDNDERKKMKEWAKEKWNDDFSWIQIAKCAAYPEYEGLRVPEIARLRGTDVYDAMYDIILDSKNSCGACFFTMCEEDVKTVLSYERAMVCTDSSVARDNMVFHPRLKATFPRVLGKYIREEKIVPLYEMIRKITSMPASVYGLETKGLIWEGMDADICIFDADKIIDKSEFTNCNQRAEGLNYVILGGEVVVEDSVFNGIRKGKVILR